MKTKTLKTTLAALLALACALGCGTTALAAEEWGVIPDDYVLSVPSPDPTFRVEQERPPKPDPVPSPKEDIPAGPDDGDTPGRSLALPAGGLRTGGTCLHSGGFRGGPPGGDQPCP